MKKRVISLASIKPYGNLQDLLTKFETKIQKIEKEGYSKEVARILKLVIECGFTDAYDWLVEFEGDKVTKKQKTEGEMIVILGHLFVIRLNNIAQKHLNKIDMEPNHVQIAQNPTIKEYFPNTTFTA